jgi:ATP-dependent RNA helicase DeaD
MASQLLPERSTGSRKASAAESSRPQPKERSRPQSTAADAPPAPPKSQPSFSPSKGKAIFRIEVGHDQSVEPGEIVGAIANEGGLNGKEIGQIQIFADHTLLELPNALPRTVFVTLKNVWIRGRRLSIHRLDAEQANAQRERSKKSPRAVKTAARGKPKPAWQKDNARPAPRRERSAAKPTEARAPKKTIKRRAPKPAAS